MTKFVSQMVFFFFFFFFCINFSLTLYDFRMQTLWACKHGLRISVRWVSSQVSNKPNPARAVFGDEVVVNRVTYPVDDCTNITPSILAKVNKI
jgi:hypothetical protein